MRNLKSSKYYRRVKFKRIWNGYKRYAYIILPCLAILILGICFTHSKFSISKEEEVVRTTVGSFIYGDVIIGAYLDDELIGEFPKDDSIYVVDKVVCDNNAIGVWNDLTWDLNVSHISKRTKCNIYFKTSKITDRIIASVDKTGKCPSVNSDGTVNVTKVEATDGYVCSAPDAYGTSYYFRGNVTNNYVKFGGYYWRILRINGDGTIRLVYDGTSAHNNNETSSDRIIGNSKYNSSANDNAYVGYMYGKTGSSNYNDTHANINDSTIKKFVDNWYTTNLSQYSTYLADNIFCNDRKISTYTDGTHGSSGYGTKGTYYRWARGPWDGSGYGNTTVSFTCPQQNDAFTVNDTSKGNGALTYPIGLLSGDDITLAGGWNSANDGYYLYTGNKYWTASAGSCTVGITGNRLISEDGSTPNFGINSNSAAVKPVINIKADSLVAGLGLKEKPYVLSVN